MTDKDTHEDNIDPIHFQQIDFEGDAPALPEEPKEEKISESMQKAIDDGWIPKDKYEGDETEWVDFNEYNFRGELMGRISKQSKLIKKYERKFKDYDVVIKELQDRNKSISEIEYKRAMKTLKEEKAKAMEEGDSSRVVEADDAIDELKRAKESEKQKEDTPPAQEGDPDIAEWLANPTNKWYHSNEDARNFADAYFVSITSKAGHPAIPEILKQVEEKVAKAFPEVVETRPVKQQKVVSGEAPPKPNSTKYGRKDLSEEELSVANKFVRLGLFKNVQEYVDDLASSGMMGD